MTPRSSTFLASHGNIHRTQITASTSGCKSQNALTRARRPTGRPGLCTQLPPRLPTARRCRDRSSGPFTTATRRGPRRPIPQQLALFFTSERSQTPCGRVPKSGTSTCPPSASEKPWRPAAATASPARPPPGLIAPHMRPESPAQLQPQRCACVAPPPAVQAPRDGASRWRPAGFCSPAFLVWLL